MNRIQTQTYEYTLDTEAEFRSVVLTVHSASTPKPNTYIQSTTTYTTLISCINTKNPLSFIQHLLYNESPCQDLGRNSA